MWLNFLNISKTTDNLKKNKSDEKWWKVMRSDVFITFYHVSSFFLFLKNIYFAFLHQKKGISKKKWKYVM